MPLIRFRRDFKRADPERVLAAVEALAGPRAPGDHGLVWLAGDRLSLVRRFLEVLDAPALGWCEVGLPGRDEDPESVVDMALELRHGQCAVCDLRPAWANAVRIPMLPYLNLAPGSELGGPWSPLRRRPAQLWYEESPGGTDRHPVPPERRKRRQAIARWARQQHGRGTTPSPEELRELMDNTTPLGPAGTSAVPLGRQGLEPVLPLLHAWLGLIDEWSRVDLLWAAPADELEDFLEGRTLRRSSYGGKRFGIFSEEAGGRGLPAEQVHGLLEAIVRTNLAREVDAAVIRFDSVGWDLPASVVRPGPANRLTLSLPREGRAGWIEVEIALWDSRKDVLTRINQWIWRKLPGAGAGRVSQIDARSAADGELPA